MMHLSAYVLWKSYLLVGGIKMAVWVHAKHIAKSLPDYQRVILYMQCKIMLDS